MKRPEIHQFTKDSPHKYLEIEPEFCYLHISAQNPDQFNGSRVYVLFEEFRTDGTETGEDITHQVKTDGFIFKNPKTYKIKISLDGFASKHQRIELIFNFNEFVVDTSFPSESFNRHIENPLNTKILFSGPYGQGKTTFLDWYFSNNPNYEVFKVFPVNYSVASNEDIFRYIKTDILFQLLGKEVEMEREIVPLKVSVQEFIYLHPFKTVATFFRMLLSLDKRTEGIEKVFSKLNPLVQEISSYHEAQQLDDRPKVVDYLKKIYEQEGTIFEDNFYTQLIRQLLEQLKENSRNENVLIIEDLDRMDPDHIFRILNVISAHYDTYRHSKDLEHHNKFGFDKIILVCDIDNIQKIFHHKYGLGAEFEGYLSKYYSTAPFHFDNKEAIATAISVIERQKEAVSDGHLYDNVFLLLKKILLDIVNSDQIKLRDLIKMSKINLISFCEVSADKSRSFAKERNVCYMVIDFLYKSGMRDLKDKFKNAAVRNESVESFSFEYFNKQLLGLLSFPVKTYWQATYKNHPFRLVMSDENEMFAEVTDYEANGAWTGIEDFYPLLQLALKEYLKHNKLDKAPD